MARPDISEEQAQNLLPEASNIQFLDQGGQKVVFTAIISERRYALKFLSPNPQIAGYSNEYFDDVTARARREVDTMEQCTTRHLVKMGPIGLQTTKINGDDIIYFSEEFIEGKNLKQYHQDHGNFSPQELISLAFHISDAINDIWRFSKIHRDIKPSNIMRRESNGDFVLLDMGLVFDLQDESLSVHLVGTPLYFSPEQMDFNNRRTVMNFRSDLFSLGIVLYEMATGTHPFITPACSSSWEVLGNIANMTPEPPIIRRPDLPQKLSDIIMRLLSKRPALRYRSVELFQRVLGEVQIR